MKNLLLSSVMLMTVTASLAQLYVTPNGATDTFVYVNDRVVYVEDDLNLSENPTATRGASLYLRNEAQLVQGAGATANSGDGYISVIQDSNSDSYDYNFWSSPVGVPTGSGNQNFGILRVHDSLSAIDSNVTTTSMNLNGVGSGMGSATPLRISRRWLYKREAGAGWTAIHTTNTVDPGLGFTMKGTNVTTLGDGTTADADANNQRYDFRGRAHNGDVSVAVLNNRVTLSGNPYPSTLDLNLFFTDADNSEIDVIRFWDEDRRVNSHEYSQNKGGYATWIPGPSPYTTGGDYTPASFLNYNAGGNPSGGSTGTGAMINRVYTPIGQGYHILGGANGTVIYKNSHRTYIKEGASTLSNFKSGVGNDPALTNSAGLPGGGNTTNLSTVPSIRVQTIFGESHYREMLLNLWDDSTDNYDRGMDATHPMDAARAEAYFHMIHPNTGDRYNAVIQTLPMESGKMIPIAFDLEEPFKFMVRGEDRINLDGFDIFMYDSEVDKYQEIGAGKDAVYNLNAGTYEDRFFIVFKSINSRDAEEALIDETVSAATMDFFQNNPAGMLEVNNPEGYDIQSANIYDMSGKLIAWKQSIGTDRSFSFPTGRLSDGIYIVKLLTNDNQVINHKISVVNK